jgi:hypothetical protein
VIGKETTAAQTARVLVISILFQAPFCNILKIQYFFFSILLTLPVQATFAQVSKEQAEAKALYRDANQGPARTQLKAAMNRTATNFVGDGTFQPGALRTFDGQRRPVPGLRYNATLRVLEAQDSIDTDSTHFWPMGSLRGFDLGEPGSKETPVRRFRPRMVREGNGGTRREYVEVLTSVDTAPLVLALLYGPAPSGTGLAPVLLAGPGTSGSDPLRPIELSMPTVLKLFGSRAEDVRSFASTQQLHYSIPVEVARMFDYFNRVAVAK